MLVYAIHLYWFNLNSQNELVTIRKIIFAHFVEGETVSVKVWSGPKKSAVLNTPFAVYRVMHRVTPRRIGRRETQVVYAHLPAEDRTEAITLSPTAPIAPHLSDNLLVCALRHKIMTDIQSTYAHSLDHYTSISGLELPASFQFYAELSH